jgi:hypothetical protein
LHRLHAVSTAKWCVTECMAEIRVMPSGRRQVVEKRLIVLQPLVTGHGERRPMTDLQEALGISRRNVYVLLDRLRRLPPIIAVAPPGGARAAKPRGMSGERDLVVEKAIVEAISANPGARLSLVVDVGRQAAENAGHSRPAAKTILRKMDALRSVVPEPSMIGRRVLLDACPVKLAVMHRGRLIPQTLAFLIDLESTELLGWGGAWVGDDAAAMLGAISCARRWTRGLRQVRGIAAEVASMEVIVPPCFEFGSVASIPPLLRLSKGGPRSSGVRLRRLLGPSVAGILLIPRADRTVDHMDPKDATEWVTIERKALPVLLEGRFRGGIPAQAHEQSDSAIPHDALDQIVNILATLKPALEATSSILTGRPSRR